MFDKNWLQEQARMRLRSIVSFAPSGHVPDLRTKLDEWAAFEVGGELLTAGGNQRWFNNPCPVGEGRRLLTYMDGFSSGAHPILLRGASGDEAVRKPRKAAAAPFRVVVEHAVPIRVLRDIILRDCSLWNEDALRRFLQAFYRRVVLTSHEDALLRQKVAGERHSLRQRMPTFWSVSDGDPYARYRAVGISWTPRSRT